MESEDKPATEKSSFDQHRQIKSEDDVPNTAVDTNEKMEVDDIKREVDNIKKEVDDIKKEVGQAKAEESERPPSKKEVKTEKAEPESGEKSAPKVASQPPKSGLAHGPRRWNFHLLKPSPGVSAKDPPKDPPKDPSKDSSSKMGVIQVVPIRKKKSDQPIEVIELDDSDDEDAAMEGGDDNDEVAMEDNEEVELDSDEDDAFTVEEDIFAEQKRSKVRVGRGKK